MTISVTRELQLFRVVVGILVLRHAVPFVEEQLHGDFFGARFHVPYAPWLSLGESGYDALLVTMLAAGVLVTAGVAARLTVPIAAAAVALHFLLNQIWYSNNRIFLALCLGLLSLAWLDGRWVALMIRAQLSFIYLGSALSKLADADWRSGDVLAGRAAMLWRGSPLLEYLTSAPGRWAMGLGAISTELFLALGLWFPRTRKAALWIGVIFHVFIEVSFIVLVFSQLTLATYLLVPAAGSRKRVLRTRSRALARLVRGLDWLEKVEVQVDAGAGDFSARDATGRELAGWRAAAEIGAALPLTFPLAWPLTWKRGPAPEGTAPVTAPSSPVSTWGAAAGALAGLAAFWVDVQSGGLVAKGAWALAIAFALTAASAGPDALQHPGEAA